MCDLSVPQNVSYFSLSFLHRLMICWVTDIFRFAPFSLLIFVFCFACPPCDPAGFGSIFVKTAQLCLRVVLISIVPWVHLQLTNVHHSLGLHSKTKRQIISTKTATQQERSCAWLSWSLTNAGTTISSTYGFERNHQRQETKNSSAAENANIARVYLFTAA